MQFNTLSLYKIKLYMASKVAKGQGTLCLSCWFPKRTTLYLFQDKGTYFLISLFWFFSVGVNIPT